MTFGGGLMAFTAPTLGPDGEGVEARLQLVVVEGDAVTVHDLPDRGSLLVGRDTDVDVRLTDPGASARHANLYVEAGLVAIEDLGEPERNPGPRAADRRRGARRAGARRGGPARRRRAAGAAQEPAAATAPILAARILRAAPGGGVRARERWGRTRRVLAGATRHRSRRRHRHLRGRGRRAAAFFGHRRHVRAERVRDPAPSHEARRGRAGAGAPDGEAASTRRQAALRPGALPRRRPDGARAAGEGVRWRAAAAGGRRPARRDRARRAHARALPARRKGVAPR